MVKARSPRPALSREKIVEAGLAILDREGLEIFSMRRLAAALNVEAMSLYNHVKDKNDLLSAAASLALRQIPLPPKTQGWRGRIEALALGLYRALLEHPAIAVAIAQEKIQPQGPETLALLEAAAAALAEAGLPPSVRVSAIRGMIALCMGFVLTHTRGMSSTKEQAQADWAKWDSGPWMNSGLPHLARLAPQFLKTNADDDLRFALKAMLDAMASKART